MNDATSSPHTIQKPKTKPGEWWFVASILFLVTSPVLFFITLDIDAKVAIIQKDGVVSEAVVKGHRTEEHTHTNSKGRTRSTTSYLLNLSYDLMSKNRFSDWNAGKPYLPSPNPANSTTEIEVKKPQYEELADGAQTMVALIPYKTETMKLASEMKWLASGTQSMIQYAISAVGLVVGIWTGLRGWKLRRAWKAGLGV